MKVAICISGQPRAIRNGYESINSNLIVPNDADVFFHTWYDDGSVGQKFRSDLYPELIVEKNTDELLVELYKPKAFKIEKQKKFKNTGWDVNNTVQVCSSHLSPEYVIDMMYCMWYSIHQSNLVKETYRLENNITYDYVIRCRFDAGLSTAIVCSNYDSNVLWISRPLDPHYLSLDDWFAFGSNDNMNIYSSAFNFMDFFRKKNTHLHKGIWTNESLVYDIVHHFGIKWQQISNFQHTCLRK